MSQDGVFGEVVPDSFSFSIRNRAVPKVILTSEYNKPWILEAAGGKHLLSKLLGGGGKKIVSSRPALATRGPVSKTNKQINRCNFIYKFLLLCLFLSMFMCSVDSGAKLGPSEPRSLAILNAGALFGFEAGAHYIA